MSLATAERPFIRMAQEMSKLIDQLQAGHYTFYPSEAWTPAVNLYEVERAYLVCVDLAGVDKDKIDLHVTGHQLTLKGARPVPSCELLPGCEEHGKMRVHLMEIDHGAFQREVELPRDVHTDGITAEYRNGMLWIELPKK